MSLKPRSGTSRTPRTTRSEIEEAGVHVEMAGTDSQEEEETRNPLLDAQRQPQSHAALAYKQPPQYSSMYSFLCALAYGVSSLLMVFLNKGVLMTYKHSMTILTMQMFVSAILLQSCAKLSVLQIRPFSWATARSLLPLATFYNANVAFALASLEGVNVPMYIALKRLTPLAILITNAFIGKARPPLQITLSVTMIALGCIIAALWDFSFDLKGYAMGLTSVVFQTAYLILVERSGAEDGLSSFELMLYNAVLSLPVLGVIIVATGEAAVSFPELLLKMNESLGFGVAIVTSLVMGIVLNYTMFLCTIVNSALTTTIVGVLKGVFTTVLGFFVLGGVKFHLLNVVGLSINSIGGVWYSVAKYSMKHPKNTSKQREGEPLLPTSTTPPVPHTA